jgi:peptide deformylase
MAVLPIHVLGSDVLREQAAPVTVFDDALREFVASMYETMDTALGVGLAANQVGLARRIAVIDAEGQRFTMINPVIVERSGAKEAAEEGCLSIPDAYAEVTRPEAVTLEAVDEQGAPFRLELTGLPARAVQHEIDHLDGILFIDYLSPLKRQFMVRKWKREHDGEGLTWTPSPEESETAG